MVDAVLESTEELIKKVRRANPDQPEFIQAVEEVCYSIVPYLEKNDMMEDHEILERLMEPDRIIQFRVTWEDDQGKTHHNRGYRVQHCNAIGTYKGGLRFHPSVNLSVLKFLAFEQTFKNALTGLPLGGAKGGSDFDPKGRSDAEIKRFCQAFMTELYRYIGPYVDVPAGDTGVGSREVSYLFGQYKKITNQFVGALTGKGLSFGGSKIRSEATGYGSVYIAEYALSHQSRDLAGMNCVVSGSGQVALFAAEKLLQKGCKVLTLSDSKGYVYFEKGLTKDQLVSVMKAKFSERKTLEGWSANQQNIRYVKGEKPWKIKCDAVFPCAVQNELDVDDAKTMVNNGLQLISEGANMPLTHRAKDYLLDTQVIFLPGKMANAGGVAVSGLEMSQNSSFQHWSREMVDDQLKMIMQRIHHDCYQYLEEGCYHYENAANVLGFSKVADAIKALG